MYAAADEFIFGENEIADELYFIVNGRVSYTFYQEKLTFPYKVI